MPTNKLFIVRVCKLNFQAARLFDSVRRFSLAADNEAHAIKRVREWMKTRRRYQKYLDEQYTLQAEDGGMQFDGGPPRNSIIDMDK